MKRDNYTDQEILTGIKHQNSEIMMFIYQKNFRSVRHYIEQNNGSDKDAEDLFQDALILIFHKVREGSLVLTSSFNTYIFSIVKKNWLKQLDKRKRQNIVIDECDNFILEEDGLIEDLLKLEREKIINQHFNELSPDCQKIITLFLKGHSITEITKVMGFSSEQHTKNRRFRCKKSLIERILKNPYFKELTNGKFGTDYQIPRW
ncbi:MAG: sigma-70 family RNA polymerase sigma factor [Bacteroidota bacterium]|nr:sigma-70 family RNA polymerase sigma factor [Bacteroidota bacterium]